MDPSKCHVLVPVLHRIEPSVDEALNELTRRGYVVRRVYGYSAIDQGRCKMAYESLFFHDAESIMWIDSDVGFNPADVDRLLSHNLPVVCGIYPVKGYPRLTTQFLTRNPVKFGTDGKLVQIRSAANGFLLTKREVYMEMIAKLELPLCHMWGQHPIYPWFMPMIKHIGRNAQYLGEDYAFCERARLCNYQIMADTRVKLQHWGPYAYTWDDAQTHRQHSDGCTINPQNDECCDDLPNSSCGTVTEVTPPSAP